MKIGRRDLFGLFAGGLTLPLISSEAKTKETEAPYNSPFEQYPLYIERLRKGVGKDVQIQDSFNIVGYGRKKLTDLIRVSNGKLTLPRLFPHAVMFDDGSVENLKGIASITEYGTSQLQISPEAESTFYLHVKGQELAEEYMRGITRRQTETFRKFD